MVNNPHLSDVQFQTDSGEVLYAHKFVLYARCPLLIQYVSMCPLGGSLPSVSPDSRSHLTPSLSSAGPLHLTPPSPWSYPASPTQARFLCCGQAPISVEKEDKGTLSCWCEGMNSGLGNLTFSVSVE